MSSRFRFLVCVVTLAAAVVPHDGAARPSGAWQAGTDSAALERLLARREEDHAALERTRRLPAPEWLRRRAIRIEPGDLLLATSKRWSALRLQIADESVKIKRHELPEEFVPRALDYESTGSWLAIAAVSRVLLLETSTGVVRVLEAPGELATEFGFVNDVLFIDPESLLIADTGPATGGPLPADGHVWRYDLTSATYTEVATSRALSNPRELAHGPGDEIYMVDGEAGQRLAQSVDFFYDVVYRLVGNRLLKVQKFFLGPGLQATAFDVGPDERLWFANVNELALLQDGVISFPCALPAPFELVTALVATATASAYLLDGAGSPPARILYQIDDACVPAVVSDKGRLKESRGLVQVPEVSE